MPQALTVGGFPAWPQPSTRMRRETIRAAVIENPLLMIVWTRDGQAPARVQTLFYALLLAAGLAGATTAVQNLQRVAATGIALRHSGQSRSVATLVRVSRDVSFATGMTMRK